MGLDDAKLNTAIDDFGRTFDKAQQVRKAYEMQRYIMEQAYTIPLIVGRMYVPHQKYVKNFVRTWGWGFAGIEKVWIDR